MHKWELVEMLNNLKEENKKLVTEFEKEARWRAFEAQVNIGIGIQHAINRVKVGWRED